MYLLQPRPSVHGEMGHPGHTSAVSSVAQIGGMCSDTGAHTPPQRWRGMLHPPTHPCHPVGAPLRRLPTQLLVVVRVVVTPKPLAPTVPRQEKAVELLGEVSAQEGRAVREGRPSALQPGRGVWLGKRHRAGGRRARRPVRLDSVRRVPGPAAQAAHFGAKRREPLRATGGTRSPTSHVARRKSRVHAHASAGIRTITQTPLVLTHPPTPTPTLKRWQGLLCGR